MNLETYKVIDRDSKKLRDIRCQDIRVGDLLYLESDRIIPADVVVLASSMPHGTCYIETAQLDG
jgi:P-type E1-E2 ATPase